MVSNQKDWYRLRKKIKRKARMAKKSELESKTIQTTWRKIFENRDMMLFLKYPEVMCRLEAYDDEPIRLGSQEEVKTVEHAEQAGLEIGDYEDLDVYQWYVIDVQTAEWLEEYTDIKAYWSDELELWILPVRHFGNPWNGVRATITIPKGADQWLKTSLEFYEVKGDI